MEVKSISEQLVPFTTGPGALKSAVISTINDGYPSKGVYKDLSSNRTITIIGSSNEARAHLYLRRSVVLNRVKDMIKMGMIHYSKQTEIMKEQQIKINSCLSEIYQKSFKKTSMK